MKNPNITSFFNNALMCVSLQKNSDIENVINIYKNTTDKKKAIEVLAKLYNKTPGAIKFTIIKHNKGI